jgi:ATP-binding cassette subfamily B protein
MLNIIVHNLFYPLAIISLIIGMTVSMSSGAKISELAAVMWSLLAALPILGGMLQARVAINSFLPSYQQLTSLLKTAEVFIDTSGDRNFKRLERNISLKGVCFTYPGRNATLINVDLELIKGEMTALVGHSGSGKTTVIDLVLGLQVPSHGVVLIDGISLNEWDINSFRGRVGYVPQDPQLLNCSIRDNLLWSFGLASDFELEEALRLSNALDFVRNLPNGIDTVVGDRGINLSGGQRQRIALARALMRKPELLILDEATSALDSESELLIQQSIEQVASGTTILVIAHRLSTIAKANKVYVLQQGEIVEEGSFAALSMQSDGILNSMIKAQQQLQQSENQKAP